MADTAEKDYNTVKRRVACVTNHLIPLHHHHFPPITTTCGNSNVELCNAASINDSYHRIHGEVPTHEVVWKLASDYESGNEFHFTDIIYEKAVGDGIAKVKAFMELSSQIYYYVTVLNGF